MKKQIQIHERTVEYDLRIRPRARMLRLSIYRDGRFIVAAPRYVTQRVVDEFILRKSQWVLDQIDRFTRLGPVVSNVFTKNSIANYKKYKAHTLLIAEAKLAKFNRLYGYTYNRISIRNQKSRWGSCSKKGNINFNYKIALLPERLVDYLVVHELCHIGRFDHSRTFWELVGKAIPDYVERRKELRNIERGIILQ